MFRFRTSVGEGHARVTCGGAKGPHVRGPSTFNWIEVTDVNKGPVIVRSTIRDFEYC